MKIRWSRRAVRDIVTIGDYIAQDRPMAARRVIRRIRDRTRQLLDMPWSGRGVQERPDDDRYRELVEGPYRIVYYIKDNDIEIRLVFDSRQELPPSEFPK